MSINPVIQHCNSNGLHVVTSLMERGSRLADNQLDAVDYNFSSIPDTKVDAFCLFSYVR